MQKKSVEEGRFYRAVGERARVSKTGPRGSTNLKTYFDLGLYIIFEWHYSYLAVSKSQIPVIME